MCRSQDIAALASAGRRVSRIGRRVSRIVAWTGHRPDLFHDPERARQAVERVAHDLVDADASQFLVGGQRGVDTWAALAAIGLAIPFRLLLPVPVDELTRDWAAADCRILNDALERAVEVRIAGGYRQRNQRLAHDADVLVAVWTGTRGGGTAETIGLARAAGTPVYEILLKASADAASATGRGI